MNKNESLNLSTFHKMEFKLGKYHRFRVHGSILREEYLHLAERRKESGEKSEAVKT
jgi:hypothetical protein